MAKSKHADKTATTNDENAITATNPDVETSEKLDQLKSEKIGLVKEQIAAGTSGDMAVYEEVSMKIWKLNADIKTEEARIATEKANAAKQEALNARVALVDNLINAVLSGGDYAEQREILVNIAIAGLQPTRAARVTGQKTGTGTRGTIKPAILALLPALYAAGMSGSDVRKEIIQTHGFNDGTANAVIKEYEDQNGLR
jgi:hypothetical protein